MPSHSMFKKGLRGLLASSLVLQVMAPVAATPTYAAVVAPSPSFGGAGTYKDPNTGTVFAKAGQPVTLQVTTDTDVQCVVITGSFSATQHLSGTSATWSFPFTAPASGSATVTANAGNKYQDSNQSCNTNRGAGTATLTVDNAAPTVTGKLSAAAPANGAGWFNKDVSI